MNAGNKCQDAIVQHLTESQKGAINLRISGRGGCLTLRGCIPSLPSQLEKTAGISEPSAVLAAPVSVAASMMRSGDCDAASANASHLQHGMDCFCEYEPCVVGGRNEEAQGKASH